jgi:hypothetical protein
MIFVQRIHDPFPDESPFLLCHLDGVIAEVTDFLKRLLLQGASHATIRAYAYDLLAFYRFMDAAHLSLDTLTPAHALNFVAALKQANVAPRSINRRITTVRSFLNARSTDSGNALFAAPRSAFYKGRRNTALLGPTRIKGPAPRPVHVR